MNRSSNRLGIAAIRQSGASLRAACLLVGVVLAGLAGCSKSGPAVYRVSGTITRHGQGVPNLMVHFVPVNGRPSWGQTDEAGRYELHYVGKQMGAAAGAHRVFVTLKRPPVLSSPPPPLSPDEMAIQQGYSSLEVSPLKTEVDRDGQTLDFALD